MISQGSWETGGVYRHQQRFELFMAGRIMGLVFLGATLIHSYDLVIYLQRNMIYLTGTFIFMAVKLILFIQEIIEMG